MEHGNKAFQMREILNERKLQGYEILFSNVINFAKLGIPQARERLIIVGLRKDLYGKLGEHADRAKRNLDRSLHGHGKNFSNYPLSPLEVFYGQTLSLLGNAYKSIMSEYEDYIGKVESTRKTEYIEQIWPMYSMNIQKDYLWVNRNNKEAYTLETWTMEEEVEKAHKRVLLELGYYGRPLSPNCKFEDNSNDILQEKKRVRERMKYIPPGENHEFVRNTEHHVTGLMSNIYRRVHPLKPSPTIIAKGGGGTWGYHFAQNRQRLTNRERARLQTFPDSFVFRGKPGEVRTQIGEAVPPLGSKVIAEQVARILDHIIFP